MAPTPRRPSAQIRGLAGVLDFLACHDNRTCRRDCDLRPIFAMAAVSPWCREQFFERGSYFLGDVGFELTPLQGDAAAVAELGGEAWELHQQQQLTYAIAQELDTHHHHHRGRVPSPGARRLTIRPYRQDPLPLVAGTVKAAPPPPPLREVIAWWRPAACSVRLEGFWDAVPVIAQLMDLVQSDWGCPVTGLGFDLSLGAGDPGGAEEEAALHRTAADCIARADGTLRFLEVQSLTSLPPPVPGLGRTSPVTTLSLGYCAVPLPVVIAWLKGARLEELYLTRGDVFTPLMHRAPPAEEGRTEATELTALTPPSLHRLVLDRTNVTPRHLASIACRRGLVQLSLAECDQVDEVPLHGMESLRVLSLNRCPITSTAALAGLASCQRLVTLIVSGCADIADLNCLAELPCLRELFAHQSGVSNEGIARLGECGGLEKVNLGGCRRLTDVRPLGRLRRLKELHLWSTKADAAGIATLGGCTALTECVLDECTQLTDVSALAGLPALRYLSLIRSSVTVAGVAALAACPALESLALAGTEVADAPRMWNHQSITAFLERVAKVAEEEKEDEG